MEGESGSMSAPVEPAVDEHEAGEVPGAGLAVEVPGSIGGGYGATERMAAQHDSATAPLRRLDHAPQILDLDAHPPLTCEPNVRIRNELEVRRDARVGEPAEVVVEQLLIGGHSLLGPVEHRVVLELILPPLHGPDLPALRLRDDGLRERREVCGACRRPRIEDQDVPRAPRPDLEHPHLVEPGRGARGLEAVKPPEPDRDLRPRRRREGRERQADREQRQPAMLSATGTHHVDLRSAGHCPHGWRRLVHAPVGDQAKIRTAPIRRRRLLAGC